MHFLYNLVRQYHGIVTYTSGVGSRAAAHKAHEASSQSQVGTGSCGVLSDLFGKYNWFGGHSVE